MRAFTATAAALLGLTLALVGAGCEKVKTSDEDIQEIGEQAVQAAVNDSKTLIVDVRKPEKYDAGHLPSAVNIFLPEIRENDARLANADTIIVYGDGWTDPLGPAAAKRMLASRYTNVFLFRGGMTLWRDAGYSVVEPGGAGDQRPESDRP